MNTRNGQREELGTTRDKKYRKSMASMQSTPESGSAMSYEQFRFNATLREETFPGALHAVHEFHDPKIVVPQVTYHSTMPSHVVKLAHVKQRSASPKPTPEDDNSIVPVNLVLKEPPTFMSLKEIQKNTKMMPTKQNRKIYP